MESIRVTNDLELDLNLLLVFDALMRDGNLTRAGYRFGLSQPAMSHALAKLRKRTGDALFVRVPHGMDPTPYALEIAPMVDEALRLLRGAMEGVRNFDPSTCERTFQILMSDIGELQYLPMLMARLAEVAPQANIRVLQMPRESYQEAFLTGEADLAIGFLPALKAGFYQQRLFEDSYVCLVRSDHPRIRRKITMAQFTQESHVLIEPAGSRFSTATPQTSTTTLIERYLADRGLSRRIALRVPHFMVVPEIVKTTNLIASVPSALKSYLGSMPHIRMLPLPFEVPRFEVKQFWHQRNHNDVANRWLRGLIAEMFTRRYATDPLSRADVATPALGPSG